MPTAVPILFLSDSPCLPGGLSRICRDLAVRTSRLPQFRVASLGRGGHGSRHLPFMQYNFPESDQWGEHHLALVWEDFAGSERGIIFTIWDAGRLFWFARPDHMPKEIKRFLSSGKFQRWGYFPVDATYAHIDTPTSWKTPTS